MNRHSVSPWSLLSMLLLGCLAGCAGMSAEQPEDEEEAMPATRFATQEFESRLAQHGGHVDFIFGDDRPHKECHASTVVESSDGVLLSAWFGGTKESHADVGIWFSRFQDGAWTPPALAAKVNETAHWNPVLFRDPARGTFLFFKVGPRIPYWQTYWMSTTDDGRSWSAPVELVPGDEGGRGPVKNKPIILSDGDWLAPASTELGKWAPFADRSEDGGHTWTRSEDFALDSREIPGKGAIQPAFWESAPGHVHALMRSGAGCVVRSDSADGGRTWSPVSRTPLPNNNSGLDALRLDDGRILLVYNPVGRNWGRRTPLNLAVSTDNGRSWRDIVSLETARGEYSYPAIVRTGAGVAVTYTWKRERVRCWQIPLAALD